MKTFDEAVDEMLKDPLALENLRAGVSHIENEKWARSIEFQAELLCVNISNSVDPDGAYAAICSSLHAAFQFGLLVGMKMEKTELPDDLA